MGNPGECADSGEGPVIGVGVGDDCPDCLALLIGGDIADDTPQNQVVAVVEDC